MLDVVRADLVAAGWLVAAGGRKATGVVVGSAPLTCVADGSHRDGAVFWVETGRGWTNNAFLLHVIEASLAPGISDVVMAILERDLEKCAEFLGALATSDRLRLPLRSLVLIGF